MKTNKRFSRIISIVLGVLTILSAATVISAVDYELLVNTSVRQQIPMYKLSGSAPVIDGTFDADAWAEYLVTDAQSPEDINIVCENSFNSLSNEEWLENIYTPVQFYATYDDTNVYFAAVTEDYDHACISTWEGDYADIRIWTKDAYDAAPKIKQNNGIVNVDEVVSGNSNGLDFAFGRDEKNSITCYEYKISWADLTGGAQEEFRLRIAIGYGSNEYIDAAVSYPPFIGAMYFGYADLTKGEPTDVSAKENIFNGNTMILSGEKPEPETEAETVEVVEIPAAPQTFDISVIAAVAAVLSAAGYAISRKR